MAKITWDDRSNSGANSRISASIFNDIKNSINSIYEDDVSISGSVLISGSIIPNVASGETTSSFDLGSETAAWKDIYVSEGSIKFVKKDETTVSFTKEEVAKLQAGKSISKTSGKQLVNENDDTTYVRMSVAGRAVHYAGNNVTADFQSDQVTLGGLAGASTGLPISLPGGVTGSLSVTGSTDISGSCTVSGSFTVTELLTLLGNYGQTGSFAVSGSSEFTGDTNFDGAVTSQDLLNVLAGFGNPSGSNVECSGSIDETYDNDILIFSSSVYTQFSNSGSFAQIKIKSGSSYAPGIDFDTMYTGSGTIDFELPPISTVGPGFSYHIINKHNILYQGNVTMSITPHSTDKFLYLPSGITGSDNKPLLSYTPSGSTEIGNGNPFIKFTYGNSNGWSITELGGTWEQGA